MVGATSCHKNKMATLVPYRRPSSSRLVVSREKKSYAAAGKARAARGVGRKRIGERQLMGAAEYEVM